MTAAKPTGRRRSSATRRQWLAGGVTVVVLLAGLVLLVLFARGWQQAEPPPPHPTELGFPPAPTQQLPQEAEGAEAGESGSIAELPDPEWVGRTAERTGIPERALSAYAGAALRVEQTQPQCRLGWNTLAGIGQVESVHGSYEGAQIGEDGVVEPHIIGVPLDGSEGVMEIPDTDDGELDGDEQWDRAVGPMQFIPTTWRQYAQDGSGDGQADVHQYDDAALTAAVYLCEHGEDLGSDRGWNDAVAAYNQSVEYANDVASFASDYAESE